MKIVVVGSGVSGLAAADRIAAQAPEANVTVLEASDRPGGGVRTERTDGFVIERGPDAIITDKPWALAWAKRLGLEGDIVSTNPDHRGAYVVCRGGLERIPPGFSLIAPLELGPFFRSPVLSRRGKMRALLDLVLPRGHTPDESLSRFVKRRFGSEVFERLAQPLAGGIYGADPEHLSLESTMPRFIEAEQRHRSVILGLRKRADAKADGVRYGLFISFAQGSECLVERAVQKLRGDLVLRQPVQRIVRHESRFRVETDEGSVEADGVILAVPAPRAASMLGGMDPELGGLLGRIPLGSVAAVTLALPRDRIEHRLDAYGFVVPVVEGRTSIASTWSSRKWSGRAPDGMELLRVFLGGYARPDVVSWDDAQLIEAARAELDALIGARGEPSLVRVDRWVRAMPQYRTGHRSLVAQIEARSRQLGAVRLAGNSYTGVGIPDAVRRGEEMADSLVAAIRGPSSSAVGEPM